MTPASLAVPVFRPALSLPAARLAFCIPANLLLRIHALSLRYFNLAQNLCVLGFGTKELAWDWAPAMTAPPFSTAALPGRKIRQKIKNIYREYSLVHGTLYLGSGFSGGLAAAHDLGWLNLGKGAGFCEGIGSGLFLFANLYSLQQNLKLYAQGMKLAQKGDCYSKQLGAKLRLSAVLGIVNNLSYILATLFAVFAAPAALSIALGCFAIFTGCLKILYDFFNVKVD